MQYTCTVRKSRHLGPATYLHAQAHLSSAAVSCAMLVRLTIWKAGPYLMPVRPTAL